MSPESEPLRRVPPPAADLDAEREVDFGRYARRIAGKWWLLLIGLVVGAVVGYLYGQTGGSTYQAQATVYLGQPLSLQLTPIQTLSSDPSGVAAIARSQAIVNEVSQQVGIPPAKLRRNISAAVLGERNRQTTNVALIGITVRGSDGAKVEDAANQIAEKVVDQHLELRGREDREPAAAPGRPAGPARLPERPHRRGDHAGRAGRGWLDDRPAAAHQPARDARRAARRPHRPHLHDAAAARGAQEVERGRVVSPAASAKVDARSARTSTVVGAFIGLILAMLAALAWPSASRLKPS